MSTHKNRMAALLGAAILILGCGKGNKASELAEAFLNDNLADNGISELTFTPLDSTRHLNDSVVASLRESAAKSGAFKKGVSYGRFDASQPLHYVSATYRTSGGDKVRQTFYMDKSHTAVVCVKNDIPMEEY